MILVHHPIQNCVGNSRIPNPRMPVLDGQLAGDDGGLVASAVIDDLQQISTCLAVNAGHAPIVKQQHIRFGQGNEPLAKAAVAVTNAQIAYFSPSWTAFQADRGRDFSVIVDGISN